MALLNKKLKSYKYGFVKSKKSFKINNWRFFFNGLDEISGSEHMFFLEFQMVNPWSSPSAVRLCTEDETGNESFSVEKKSKSKDECFPSYCSVRVSKLGSEPKNLCCYIPLSDVNFSKKPFSIEVGDIVFSEKVLKGRLSVSERDGSYKPEYMCDKGYAVWDLTYEIKEGFAVGYNDESRWFPSGLRTLIGGKILFDGVEYKVKKESSHGYSERFWGRNYPSPWFHLSANELISEFSGKVLNDSSFSVHGLFDNRLSFVGKINGTEIVSRGDIAKNSKKVAWDCVKMPETDKDKSNLIHWSCSFPIKNLVIDIDVYCPLNDLLHRIINLPESAGGALKLLEGYSDTGEIKIYRKNGNNLEQIEHARINKVVCEYGAQKKKD